MAAGKYNFVVEQGSEHTVTFRYKLSGGSYQDLTGWRIRMSVKDHITDTAYVYQATSDSSEDSGYNQHFTISAQASDTLGEFSITIPTATTTGFTFNQGVYDLELIDDNDAVTRLLEGKFKISKQVSE